MSEQKRPVRLHRGGKVVLPVGNTKHPYLKLPPRYEQENDLGITIGHEVEPKVYGILPGQEFVGREGWVSIVYAFRMSDVALETNTENNEEETPFEEDE
tara:strand:- start:170 stop:466 length:297 start_codon:yes stop_codon:yes gene_type:complete